MRQILSATNGRTDEQTNEQGDSRSLIDGRIIDTRIIDMHIIDKNIIDARIIDTRIIDMIVSLSSTILYLWTSTLMHVCMMHVSLIMDPKSCVYDAYIVCTILDPDVCMMLDPY